MHVKILAADSGVDFNGVFTWLKARAIAGIEVASAASYERLVTTKEGINLMRVSLQNTELLLETDASAEIARTDVYERASKLFDADEMLVRAIIGQQVSVAWAKSTY